MKTDYCVYVHVSPNGKHYVRQTGQKFWKRCTGTQMTLTIFLPTIVQNGITKAEQIMWLDSEMKKDAGYKIIPR